MQALGPATEPVTNATVRMIQRVTIGGKFVRVKLENTFKIDGLWALVFGKGAPNNGPTNTLFFTAGPFDEQHGLFGKLEVAPPPGQANP